MSTPKHTDHVSLPLGKRGAFEGVARRHGRRRNPARTLPRSSLRTPDNQLRHNPQRWVEKRDRSVANSETPQQITDFDGAILLFPSTINLQAPAYKQALTACGAPPLGLPH